MPQSAHRKPRAGGRRDRRLGEPAQCPTRSHQLDVHNRKSPRQNGSSISQVRSSIRPRSKSQNLCDEVLGVHWVLYEECVGYISRQREPIGTTGIRIGGNSAKMTATTVSSATAGPAPSNASLSGLDGVNFFNAGILAGFGPYVAAYLADQKWTQENIGFVLTASGLAGLLSAIPGGELLDAVRSKRAIVAAGATIVAISALIIALQPSFPLVFTALMLQGSTGGFLGPAIVAISLGLVGHTALPERLGRNQRFSSTGNL